MEGGSSLRRVATPMLLLSESGTDWAREHPGIAVLGHHTVSSRIRSEGSSGRKPDQGPRLQDKRGIVIRNVEGKT